MTTLKSSLVGLLLLLYLSSTGSGLGSVVSRVYSFINAHYSWQDAQSYCRNSGGDLATIYRQSDIEDVDLTEYHAWIGLKAIKEQNYYGDWRWYWYWVNQQQLNFWDFWDYNKPFYGACAFIYYKSKKAHSDNCGQYYFFICDESNFIPVSKTWNDAKAYCNTIKQQLAIYDNSGDINSHVAEQDFPVWIGLYREGQTWKWSTGVTNYTNWADYEPGKNGDCVSITSVSKKMTIRNCADRFPFTCYWNNLILVKENKTWEEALEYCRALSSPTQPELRYELISVQPQDYKDVMNNVMEADTEEVWTGLRFLAGEWLWMNGADMMYSDLPLCPSMVQHCGVLSKSSTGSMEIRDCAERRNFLCYDKTA